MRRLRCGSTEIRDVRVQDGKDGPTVSVGGAPFTPDVRAVSNGTFVFRNGRSTETFHCVRDGSTIHLFWRGTVYRLVEEAEARRGADRHGGSLEAPMPGKVIKVSVEPGCTVKKGDEIFVVEAMKMENAVRAPCDGTVKSVAIRVGDMVDTGVALVEIA